MHVICHSKGLGLVPSPVRCAIPRPASFAVARRNDRVLPRNSMYRSLQGQHRCLRVSSALKNIVEVNGESLEFEITNRDRPILLDAYATWCGPCLLLAKELEQVAETMGDSVKILKLDVDKNDDIASALAIQGLPTLIFVPMDPNKPALRTEGLLPAQTIIDIIENELNGGATGEEALTP